MQRLTAPCPKKVSSFPIFDILCSYKSVSVKNILMTLATECMHNLKLYPTYVPTLPENTLIAESYNVFLRLHFITEMANFTSP